MHDYLESLKQQKRMYELGLDNEMTKEDYQRILNAIEEQEKSI